MNPTRGFSPLCVVGGSLAAALVTGCAAPSVTTFRPVPTQADLHRIEVVRHEERLEISAPHGAPLDEATIAEARAFSSKYAREGAGPFVISAPESRASDSVVSALSAIAADESLTAEVPDQGVLFQPSAPSDKGVTPIVLTFSRFEAVAPLCPPVWSDHLGFSPSNAPSKNFGCAQNANLAAMIVNASDLDKPRDMDPSDNARRQFAYELWRQGKSSHSARSIDERINVSEVATESK